MVSLSCFQLEKKIVELKALGDAIIDPTSQQVNDLKVKHIAASKAFYDLWDVSYSESRRIIERIKQQVKF